MANEATISASLMIKVGNVDFASRPPSHRADIDATDPVGPTPGAISVSTAGTDVDLTELTTPGLCLLQNYSDTYTVQVGIWDPESVKFYPVIDLLPGEHYVIRLSEDLSEETGTGDPGTALTGPRTNRLRLKAIAGAAIVMVGAFDK